MPGSIVPAATGAKTSKSGSPTKAGLPLFVTFLAALGRSLLRAAFLAGAFFAATFLAGAFFAATFLAGAFLAATFLAGAFLMSLPGPWRRSQPELPCQQPSPRPH